MMEVYCQLYIAHYLGYISSADESQVNAQANRIAAMLSGMRRKRLATNTANPLTAKH